MDRDRAAWLHHDHAEYEAMLAECESAAEAEDWGAVRRLFDSLDERLQRHMRMEEEVLYPAYEALPNAPATPTAMLRDEHRTIRRVVDDVRTLLDTKDSEAFLESLAFLDRTLTRHHEHEEDIFLPMAGHALLGEREAVLAKLEGFDEPG